MSRRCSRAGIKPGIDIGSSEQDLISDDTSWPTVSGLGVPLGNEGHISADGDTCCGHSESTTTTEGGRPTAAVSMSSGGGGRGGIGESEPASLAMEARDELVARRSGAAATSAAHTATSAAASKGESLLTAATDEGATEGMEAQRWKVRGRPEVGTLLSKDQDRGWRVLG